jgi:L,D-transpeptidase YcbB
MPLVFPPFYGTPLAVQDSMRFPTPVYVSVLLFTVGLATPFTQTPSAGVQDPGVPHGTALQARLADLIGKALDARDWPDGVHTFYAARRHQPGWMSAEGRAAAEVILGRMEHAHEDGLSPAEYPVARLATLLATTPETLADAFTADVEVTAGLLRFARDLAHGIGADDEPVRDLDVAVALSDVRDAASAERVLRALDPVHAPFHELRRALADYHRLAADGGWPAVPDGPLLRLDDDEEADEAHDPQRVALLEALCARLAVTGDLDRVGDTACAVDDRGLPQYTPALEQAVRDVQARHGLVVDGIVGPRTIAALNEPVEDRITQIAVNMNRWRRLPDELGARHVHVNIPGFRLEAVEDARVTLDMRVVTGEPDWPTPVMIDEISYLEFRPYWNVPASITQRTLWPQIQRNPAYLRQQGFEVVRGWSEPAEIVDPASVDWSSPERFPYRIRQRPGPNNAMGLVKFMFPNEHAVYLHDTPADHRFEERRRAFSHGCVRVEDPVSLAAFLLRDQGWSPVDVRDAMHGEERQVVHLDEPVPVYLSYFSAWVEDGSVQFRGDLYGLDARDRRAFETN